MKKSIFFLVATVAIITVVSLIVDASLVEKQEECNDKRQIRIREKLQKVGYQNISFGEILPSSDGAYVIHFSALSPTGESKRGVALLFRDELRIY